MGFIILALMKKICCVFITFYSLTFLAYAQTFDATLASKLQNNIDSISIANNLKGISASVYYPGMGTWKGVTGISHSGTPITSDMLFAIGSNTKLFTAVLLLKLAENNLIQLDDSLHQHIPSFNNIDSNITTRQLLNHTSGLADVSSIPGYPDSMLTNPNRVFTASELITWVPPPLFPVGTDWSYCNTNYLLAGMIAESATGQSYSQLLRDHILNPLQLDSTFLDVYETILFPVAHPWQGGLNNQSTPRASINSAAWAAGAMYSTSEEMTHWYNTLFNAQILNSNSLNELTTFVGSGNYGMGISQKTVLGRTVWTHGGNIWGGYSSSMMFDPSTGIIICVLINQLPHQANLVSIELLSSLINNPLSFTENNINEKSLNIFPNPTSDIVTINGIKSLNDVSYIHLLDNKGTLLKNIGINDTQVDLTSFTAGIYFIKIKHQLGSVRCKVIKLDK